MRNNARDSFINKKAISNVKPLTPNENQNPLENASRSSNLNISPSSKFQKEEDEFWKDCIEESSNLSNHETDLGRTKESTKHVDDDYLTFNEDKYDLNAKFNNFMTKKDTNTINTDVQNKFKVLMNKMGFDTNETNQKHNTISHQQKESIERCHLLYEKGKIKNEVNKLIFIKNNEIREKAELSECTFKPRTNSAKKIYTNKDFTSRPFKDSIYHRAVNFKKKYYERIDKEKILLDKNNVDCTFKPKLNNNDVSVLFQNKNHIINDLNTRNFMMRLQKARNEEKEKKERIMQNTKQERFKRHPMRSSSVENGFYVGRNMQNSIKHLHSELHSLTLDNNNN